MAPGFRILFTFDTSDVISMIESSSICGRRRPGGTGNWSGGTLECWGAEPVLDVHLMAGGAEHDLGGMLIWSVGVGLKTDQKLCLNVGDSDFCADQYQGYTFGSTKDLFSSLTSYDFYLSIFCDIYHHTFGNKVAGPLVAKLLTLSSSYTWDILCCLS